MANHTSLAIGGDDTIANGNNSAVQVVSVELDMADVASDLTTFATGDTVTMLQLPADTYFQFVRAECVTALAGITQLDIGDEADDDQFVAAATTVSAGTDLTVATTDHTDGKVTLAASQVNAKLTGTPSTGILRIVGLVGKATRNVPAKPKVYTNS